MIKIMALSVIYILSLWAILDFQVLSALQTQNHHRYYDNQLLQSYPKYHCYKHVSICHGYIIVPTQVHSSSNLYWLISLFFLGLSIEVLFMICGRSFLNTA